MRSVSFHIEVWAAKAPFRTTGYEWTSFDAVVCQIRDKQHLGRGQGVSVYYMDEDCESMLEQLESVRSELERGASRDDLLGLLPPGGARNAADSALWDLEANQSARSAWTIAGVNPDPVETLYTIGLESEPGLMAEKAARLRDFSLLKIKLDEDRPLEKLEAVRQTRPDARLIVDANQGWSFELLREVLPGMQSMGVLLIEQPLARGADEALESFESPITLCADESCLHRGEIDLASRRYQMINIKLDKSGGLTHALEIAAEARHKGLRLMVGCRGHNSLSMAPAHILAQQCDYVDLDGPLLLRNDLPNGFAYENGVMYLPRGSRLWGNPP